MNAVSQTKKIIILLLIILVPFSIYLVIKTLARPALKEAKIAPVTPIKLNSKPFEVYHQDIALIIKSFDWLNAGQYLSTETKQTINSSKILSKKKSPDGNWSGELSKDKLIVRSEITGEEKIYPIADVVEKANFAFLTDKYLILIEKEDSFRKIDRIFLISVTGGTRLFLTGSFTIVDRLDLGREPLVLARGTQIIFKDNAGNFWQLNIIFNK